MTAFGIFCDYLLSVLPLVSFSDFNWNQIKDLPDGIFDNLKRLIYM